MAVLTHYKAKCSQGHVTERPHNDIRYCDTCGEKVAFGWKVETERRSDLRQDQRINRLVHWLDKHPESSFENWGGIYEVQEADAYSAGETIIIADWNALDFRGLGRYIEYECGLSPAFSDEYSICECGKAVRTQPDCYGWTPNYLLLGDGYLLLCRECALNDIEALLGEFINNDSRAARSWAVEALHEAGFQCLENEDSCNRDETGFHSGRNDAPQKVASWIEENLPRHDYVFVIDGVGQFDCHWSVLVRSKDYEGD